MSPSTTLASSPTLASAQIRLPPRRAPAVSSSKPPALTRSSKNPRTSPGWTVLYHLETTDSGAFVSLRSRTFVSGTTLISPSNLSSVSVSATFHASPAAARQVSMSAPGASFEPRPCHGVCPTNAMFCRLLLVSISCAILKLLWGKIELLCHAYSVALEVVAHRPLLERWAAH